MENRRRAWVFVAVTLVISWLAGAIWWAVGPKDRAPFMAFLTAYMFIPMAVAIVLQKVVYKEPLRSIGVVWKLNRWLLAAVVVPPIIALASLGVGGLMPGVQFSRDAIQSAQGGEAALAQLPEQVRNPPPWLLISAGLLLGMLAGVTINGVAGFGEELGWRGFLQHYLGDMGFWRYSYLIGLVWGIWHAPVILQGYNYPAHPRIGVLMMVLQMTLLSPLLTLVRLRSGSVIAAAIMHGTINGTFGISALYLAGGSDLTIGALGLAGTVVLIAANIIIFVSGCWRGEVSTARECAA